MSQVVSSRLVRVLVAAVICAFGIPTIASAESSDQAARRAAAEIQAARDRADAAADAMWDTENRIDALEIEIADAEKETAKLGKRVD